MLVFIDRLSDVCGKLAAAMFFVVGGIITYEVVARYVFIAPTIWAEELSRFIQIWATYLGAAYVLRHRHLIAIDLLTGRLGAGGRLATEVIGLLFIAGFCLVAIVYGTGIVVESVRLGRATATMLSVPQWMTESAIPLGMGLLFLQCLAELLRRLAGRLPGSAGEPDGI
ncbi:TRAP transporter small permease [Shumkonia mesophila]|uniref:TRAP transporter small permease n=1 Tax=Shumkonia mesophila TaxID=2838854 RepID=UPI0029345DCF|nr:TRAP transporter small permease [Shumkonia mesophila]